MKQVIVTLLLCLTLNFASSQPQKLQGLWTECTGTDSIEVFQCRKGYKNYYIINGGLYISADSMVCNSKKKEVTGRWEIVENLLTIFHDTNECITSYPSNMYKIVWRSDDLFYSTSIGTVDWEGQKIFTVFKRIK